MIRIIKSGALQRRFFSVDGGGFVCFQGDDQAFHTIHDGSGDGFFLFFTDAKYHVDFLPILLDDAGFLQFFRQGLHLFL